MPTGVVIQNTKKGHEAQQAPCPFICSTSLKTFLINYLQVDTRLLNFFDSPILASDFLYH